ncbi:hypothetical protein F4804DRAFT_349040 [Jackrogersella minutella]|nr:hypothetical protein F4804DRAFT_349040 [Jackrogersella minutella]
MTSLTQQLCKSLQAPATSKRFKDAGVGLAFIVFIQFLVIPLQITLNLNSINLPASILVSLLLWLLMIVANYIHEGTARLYMKYLRAPTDFLGRHMSFGFVASFILLNRDHVSDAIDVPKIAGAFIITNLLGYISSFVLATGSFKLEQRARGRQPKTCDLESNNKSWPSPSTSWPAPPTDGSPLPISQLSRISAGLMKNDSFSSIELAKRGSASLFIDHLVRTAPVWICVFLLAVVGIPVYFATGYQTPFEALCFVFFWVLAVQFQRSLKASRSLLQFPRLKSATAIMANPVVIASVLGTCYLWIKTAYTKQSIDVVISEFHRHDTLAEGIIAIIKGGNLTSHIGAGDLSGPVLDAGIVCMGFKMFEYRKELWESCATVFTTCAILAVANVFLNVLIARALRLEPADSLAFAARSVTIALGNPAIQNLGGSTMLMSGIVIFGGILFQIAGDWVFSLLRINDRKSQQKLDYGSDSDVSVKNEKGSRFTAGTEDAVIAAGVMVGINAAAMGTAHLIERDSRAVAYSALSMTMFGTMTVALTALPGISDVIVSLASR